jgi:hypothetical protein
MTPFSWHDAYYSELQSLYALLVVPVAFLAWRLAAPCDPARAVVPQAARFVSLATLVFTLQTMLDPIATGPLLKSAALRDTLAASLVPFLFVYLGDLRVLVVARAVMRPAERFRRTLGFAAGVSAIVPIATGGLYLVHRAIWPDANGQWMWMIYEAGFFALCVVAARVWLPRESARSNGIDGEGRAFLAALFGYSAAYYALWLAADVVIVVAGLDLGWAIRMVPNQLYYAFWTPFVYLRFFSGSSARSVRSAA